jgi:hypothetical protein
VETTPHTAMPAAKPATVAEVDSEAVRAGQRRINLIWEWTQAIVTVLITAAAIYAALLGHESSTLNNGFFVVISTYLARTNHTKTGGVGATDTGR